MRRTITAALIAIFAVATIGLTPAEARHWHRGNAAFLGLAAGVIGAAAAVAAADNYGYRYGCYGCYGGPYYAYPAPYYGYHRWHHWRRW